MHLQSGGVVVGAGSSTAAPHAPMLSICALATFAVLLGAVIGASRTSVAHLLGPIRAAGLGSGCFAVFGQLLPEATHDLGLLAILPFGVALFASTWIERAWWGRRGHAASGGDAPRAVMGARASLELGLVALGVHQFVEGIALAALGRAPGGIIANGKLGILLALCAHTIPIVAMLTMASREAFGLRGTIVRVGILATVSGLGVLSTDLPLADAVLAHEGWIHAAVAGLLLHAVLHAASAGDPHTPTASGSAWSLRARDALGFGAGAALVVAGILATGSASGFRSGSTWIVLVASVIVAVLVHRAWPHSAKLSAIGF